MPRATGPSTPYANPLRFTIGVGQFVLVVPGAVADQHVDVRAIRAVGIAEHPQRRVLDSPPCVAWNSSACLRMKLRSGGSSAVAASSAASASSFVCNGSRSRKIPDNVTTTSMRGRPSRSSGIKRAPVTPAVAIAPRFGAHQPQYLRDRPAFGFQVIGAPQHHRDGFRQGAGCFPMARQQAIGLTGAIRDREDAGNAERIEPVQIAAGRQHVGRAQQIPTRRRTDEPPSSAWISPGISWSWASRRVQARALGGVGDAGRIQHRRRVAPRSAARRRHADRAGSACIRVPAARRTERRSRRRCAVAPGRLGRRQIDRRGLRLDQAASASRWVVSASGSRPRQRSSERLQIEQARDTARHVPPAASDS